MSVQLSEEQERNSKAELRIRAEIEQARKRGPRERSERLGEGRARVPRRRPSAAARGAEPDPANLRRRLSLAQVMALWEEAQHTSSVEVQQLHNKLLQMKQEARVAPLDRFHGRSCAQRAALESLSLLLLTGRLPVFPSLSPPPPAAVSLRFLSSSRTSRP